MKIAIVHDYIKEYGGAERVMENLHEVFPGAPIYTTVYLPKFLGPHKERFKKMEIKTSFLQYLPFKAKLISPIRLIAPLAFKRFDFSEFDAVIVSATGAYNPNVIKVKNRKTKKPVHFCYCHTPPRYLYGYATAREWKKNPLIRILGETANHFLRIVDSESSENVDYFIANSENVKNRIRKFYRKDATVIYPPVETVSSIKNKVFSMKNTKYKIQNTGYYLAGGRLARPKHIDLIVKTFVELNLPLKVFGKAFAGYGEELMQISKKNKSKIEFVGEISDEEKMKLMANAKAYVFASEDEDFGITPVEAMSVGVPVIAYRSGGVLETVVEKKTGLFFNELNIKSLSLTIKKLEELKINPKDCIKRAEKFSSDRFKKDIKNFVINKL